MQCHDAREHLLDWRRGRLAPELQEQVRAHVEDCRLCAHEATADRMLDEILERRLPQYAAPRTLKRGLAASWPVTERPHPSWWARWGRAWLPATAVAVVLLAVLPLAYRFGAGSRVDQRALVDEAANDHIRVVSSQHRVDIASSDMHQVKPWFAGRLDFAPDVRFLGDADFPLEGGAVGYFLDRQAAVFVFRRRLHVVSLLVFRAEGLPWPGAATARARGAEPYRATARGFTVLLWRGDALGYALVSDIDAAELLQLADKLVSRPS